MLDQNEQPIPYAFIDLLGAQRGAYSEPDGEFCINGVPPGRYTVRLELGQRKPEQQVTVTAGQETRVEFHFHKPPPLSVDSLALFGGWRWARTTGSMVHVTETPPSSWSRVLEFRRDGTYCFWEFDSIGAYIIRQGKIVVSGPPLRVQLENWPMEWFEHQEVTFFGPDTISTYPYRVTDASTTVYVREKGFRAPDSAAILERPPRIRSGPWGAFVELPEPVPGKTLQEMGIGREVMDWEYPVPVRQTYRYAHDQIPSGLIADFDGDGTADAVIQGESLNEGENMLVSVLSNRGSPRPVLLFTESMVDSSDHVSRARPTFFLRLVRKGQVAERFDGSKVTFDSNAILVSRPGGYSVSYLFERGGFVRGASVESAQWSRKGPF